MHSAARDRPPGRVPTGAPAAGCAGPVRRRRGSLVLPHAWPRRNFAPWAWNCCTVIFLLSVSCQYGGVLSWKLAQVLCQEGGMYHGVESASDILMKRLFSKAGLLNIDFLTGGTMRLAV